MDGRGPLSISAFARAAFCALALAFVALGHAQPDHAGDAVRFRTYSTPEGLSQATARAIAQDRDGFIWIGTQDGLNRFDGYRIRQFFHNPSNENSMVNNDVHQVVPDGK